MKRKIQFRIAKSDLKDATSETSSLTSRRSPLSERIKQATTGLDKLTIPLYPEFSENRQMKRGTFYDSGGAIGQYLGRGEPLRV